MNLAVVDDEPMIAQLVKVVFELEGHQVTTITRDFVVCLRAVFGWELYDGLLCDLMLPGITGVAIIRAAKQFNPTIRAVALTAGHPDSTLSREASKVADLLLFKPQSPDRLIAAFHV